MDGKPVISLAQVRVASPCPADWDAMASPDGAAHPDDRRRLCAACRKHVHHLSAMTADEAHQLLCASNGDLCVRYTAGPDGRPLTLDYLPQRPPRYRWRVVAALSAAAAVCAGTASLLWCKATGGTPVGPPGPMIVVGTLPPPRPLPPPPSTQRGNCIPSPNDAAARSG